MATDKEGGRFKVILFMHTHDKTEEEQNTDCVEEIKKAKRENSQHDKLRHIWERTEE